MRSCDWRSATTACTEARPASLHRRAACEPPPGRTCTGPHFRRQHPPAFCVPPPQRRRPSRRCSSREAMVARCPARNNTGLEVYFCDPHTRPRKTLACCPRGNVNYSTRGSEGPAAQPSQASLGRPDRTVFAAQEAVVVRLLQGVLELVEVHRRRSGFMPPGMVRDVHVCQKRRVLGDLLLDVQTDARRVEDV